jgi:hypothetical protein
MVLKSGPPNGVFRVSEALDLDVGQLRPSMCLP